MLVVVLVLVYVSAYSTEGQEHSINDSPFDETLEYSEDDLSVGVHTINSETQKNGNEKVVNISSTRKENQDQPTGMINKYERISYRTQ